MASSNGKRQVRNSSLQVFKSFAQTRFADSQPLCANEIVNKPLVFACNILFLRETKELQWYLLFFAIGLHTAFNCVDTNLNFTLPQRKTLLNCIAVCGDNCCYSYSYFNSPPSVSFAHLALNVFPSFHFISFRFPFVVFGFPCAFRFHALHYLISSVLNSTRKWKWQHANMCMCVY